MRISPARRRMAALTAGLLGVMALPVVAFAAPASAAEPVPVDLTMVDGSGYLHIRDSATNQPLGDPTTMTGTADPASGALAGLSFATPKISFVQHITSPIEADIYIDATFSEVNPGSGTGALTSEGDVVASAKMNVNLHIEVGKPALIAADCISTPVNLNFRSTTPYDPATKQVTVGDPNFTIPPIQPSPTCISLISDGVNAQLAGSGHSIALTMQGDLTLPPAPTVASRTALTAEPATPTKPGEDVTLQATVVSDDAGHTTVPTGAVEFSDGTDTLGVAQLVDGVATLTTPDVSVGTRTLTARYLGDGTYSASNGTATHRVLAVPTVTANVPTSLTMGAPPVPFDIVASNPDLGADVTNAQVLLNAAKFANLVLEVQDADGNWTVVPFDATTKNAVLGGPTGFALAAGSDVTIHARVSASATATATDVPETITLAEADPATGAVGATLDTTASTINIGLANRAASKVVVGTTARQGVTPVVLQRGTLEVWGATASAAAPPTVPVVGATYSYAIDGRPVPARNHNTPEGSETTDPIPTGTTLIDVPADIGPGSHTLTVSFPGSRNLLPSQLQVPFTVASTQGGLFDCRRHNPSDPTQAWVGRARVDVQGNLPALVASGQPVSIDNLRVAVRLDRTTTGVERLSLVPNATTVALPHTGVNQVTDVEFDFGPAGTGTATSVSRAGGTAMRDAADPVISQTLDFGGETGTVTVTGAPGTVAPITLTGVELHAVDAAGAAVPLTCVPVDAAPGLGTVTVTGTSLAVTAPTPTHAGDPVVLTATVAPATATGTVVFRDNGNDVGVATLNAGTASVNLQGITAGAHSFTATFTPKGSLPATTSAAVALQVLPAIQCPAAPGNAAYVRGVYLAELGRCPDAARLASWTAKLDAGTPRSALADGLAMTPAALGVSVDDAYAQLFGRMPTEQYRAQWVAKLQSGTTYQAMLGQLAGSAAFAASTTDTGFVDALDTALTGNRMTADGKAAAVASLTAGRSRAAVAAEVAASDATLTAIVQDRYQAILGREAAASYVPGRVAALRNGASRADLDASLLASQAFYDRAQTLFNA